MLTETDYFAVKHVLLVEDSLSSAMVVNSVFSSAPMEFGRAKITHVESLGDAFSTLSNPIKKDSFDIVLLDLTLSDSTGLETITSFRKKCSDIGIVVLTGSNDEELGMNAIALGAQNFLFKDETYPKLLIRQSNYAHHRFKQETQLREAKEQAEMATALKDKYVSLVSHDLRNPLGAVIGALTLATNNDAKITIPAEEKEKLTIMALNSSKELLNMVEELLDLSQLQRGFIKPIRTFNNFFYIVNEVINRLSFTANEKKIEIKNEINKKARIYSDRMLTNQLIQNVLSNAIKFSHKNSIIRIYSPDKSSIAVEDTGVGIPKEKIASLTSLEIKTTTLGTNGEKGSGIGLPHCNEILLVHNGELLIESEPGVKTTIVAKFPDIRPKIMVVDDDKSIVQYVKRLLEDLDVEIIDVSDGNTALTALTKEPLPDLVLLDVVLPDIDGITILETLKKNPKTESVPVIIMTGDNKITTRGHVLGIGAADFVEKPIKIEELIPRINNIIG